MTSDSTANSQLLLLNSKDYKASKKALAEKSGLNVAHDKCLNPFGEDSDDSENELSRSVEIRAGNRLRPRCNTERKLEKLRNDRSKQVHVRTISWRESEQTSEENPEDMLDLFPKKERIEKEKPKKKNSLLSRNIETIKPPEENPFADFSRFDATDKPSSESMTVRVLLNALFDTNEDESSIENEKSPNISQKICSTPVFIEGRVHCQTTVKEVIGFICWKYMNEGRKPCLTCYHVDNYSFYLADPDGSIDWELRPLEKFEAISKFGFSDYALVNVEEESTFTGGVEIKVTLPDGSYCQLKLPSRDITAQAIIDKVFARHKIKTKSGVVQNFHLEAKSQFDKPMESMQSLHTVDDTEFFIIRENSRRCAEFKPSEQSSNFSEFNAMDASTYQEYRDVFLLTKIPIRTKMAVVLAISQDKFDIIPHQTPSGRLWQAAQSIPKEGSFNMDIIAACEITEKEVDDDQWVFKLVLENRNNSYKKVFFQGHKDTVAEVINKMSHLLQWHSTQARSNYISYKELKNRRRKTNLF